MILIVVKHPVKAEYADRWPELMAGFTAATRAEEGNISFDWARSADDPNCWILVEAFRDSDAGASHVQTEHFQAATKTLPKMLARRPEIVYVDLPQDGWSEMAEFDVEE